MNKVILNGRATKDAEVRYTTGNQPMAVATFTLAVDREFKKDGQPDADFPRIKVFGKRAEWAQQWVKKGVALEIEGRIETGMYKNQEGRTVSTTEVVAEKVNFAMKNSGGGGNGGGGQQNYQPQQQMPPQGAPQGYQQPPQGYQQPPVQQMPPHGAPQGYQQPPQQNFASLQDDDIPF